MRNAQKLFIPVLIIILTVQVISEYFYLEGINQNDEVGPKNLARLINVNTTNDWHKISAQLSADKTTVRVRTAAKLSKSEPSNTKLILFGSKWWFDHYPYLKETQKICPKCIFTEDIDMFESSDAVIFHGMTLPRIPPSDKRPPGQIWVWFQIEAPDKRWDRHKFAENYIDVINWTMTYRSDSDVPMPYGEVISNEKMARPSFEEAWAFIPSDVPSQNVNELYDESVMRIPTLEDLKDRKMAAWIASNCVSPSKREKVVRALQKHIKVDTYGYCGKMPCKFARPDRTASGNLGIDCRIEISKKYKFYLAFENTLCEDYVTEKYFDTLFTQMVPIVYGAANYSAFAPDHSYINVNDFDSIEELANYLKFLDKNPEEYLKYFEWKKHYWVKNNGYITGYCALCDKVWSTNNTHKSYRDLEEWWFRKSDYDNSGEQSCMTYQDFLIKRKVKNKSSI